MTTRLRLTPLQVCLVTVLVFVSAVTAQAQTTALFFESQAGESIGQGATRTYLPADGTFAVSASYNNGLSVSVNGSSFWWRLEVRAAGGVPLAVGAYSNARRAAFTTGNGLDFSGSGGCNTLTGWFEVLEIVRALDGSVTRLAIDFEQHCNDGDPGLYGAIRYNSTISDFTPFQGNYPLYQLTIAPHADGRVVSTGVDCGAGNSACQATLTTPASVTLTATPNPGYLFAGWTGYCEGGATVSLRLNGPKSCAALFEPLVTTSGRSLFIADPQPGDPATGGRAAVYSPGNSTWTVTTTSDVRRVDIQIQTPSTRWTLAFAAPTGTVLTPGSYDFARRDPTAHFSGLVAYESGGSCYKVAGRFVIHEFVLGANGTVDRFAADFEQHCNDADPALFGAIRYRSTNGDVNPFQGNYPRYQITITPATHGRVTGGGLDCGSSGGACERVLAAPETLTLTATPDSGHTFAGWLGDCAGQVTTTVRVNGPKACTAFFEPVTTTAARTFLFLDSQTGDYPGGGRKLAYSSPNSRWTVTKSGWAFRTGVRVRVLTADGEWNFDFTTPQGPPFAAGYYSAARRSPFTSFNGLSATGSGGCNQLTGRFVVLEYVAGPNDTIQRFAADFEQHCEDLDPGWFGAIRYNSTIDEVVPFGGVYPSYQLTVARPVHGRVTLQGAPCDPAQAQCQLTSETPTTVALTATPDFGYIFVGWTEDCSGGASTTLHVNGPKRCAARFEPSAAVTPRTLVRLDRSPDGYLPQGWSGVLSSVNSIWTAARRGDGVGFLIRSVDAHSEALWHMDFEPPTGEMLEVGRKYTGAGSYPKPGQAALDLFGDLASCGGSGTGEFTVRELVFGWQDTVLRFAADFVQTCSPGVTLSGSLQYNSTIDVPPTTLTVEPTALRFATLYQGVTVTRDPAPQALRLTISRADVGWTATANQPWITLTPSSGTGSTAITVAANLLGGHPGNGSASGTITITLTDGTGTAKTVNLAVVLYPTGTTTHPFGTIDTPLPDRTGVTGAVPITGWALDDVEVATVTICRAAVAGESAPADAKCGGATQMYVGDAVVIEGARPDVQTAYSTFPRNDAAGWGFLLLTNTLPNQGNGTFVFYVYARDREGFVVQLGTRTMTCDNANANSPFGTIDTPVQGETVGGTNYVNFGWALTQNPKSIPVDGSSLMVYVDGVPVGNPSYNHYRPDIAAIFPGLANSNGAIGFKIIDTTALANGLHTIVWTATDSAGATSGLGSRFFRVLNGTTSSVTTTSVSAAMTAALSSEHVAALPQDVSPIAGRRSWKRDAPWHLYAAGRSGRAILRGEELDRFELALGARAGERYDGYLRVGDLLRPLPAGSRLDAETGTFTWSPGAGFVGSYDVVFIRTANRQPVARREVRFILQPKGSGQVGAQAVIDTPRAQQDVVQPFAVSGWAVDLDAATGTGIDALHAWAYPVTGGAPVFLGATSTFGARPDVGTVHGDQFRDAGFGLVVQGLAPGTYDVAVFPWSTVIAAFAPPQIVRVTVR